MDNKLKLLKKRLEIVKKEIKDMEEEINLHKDWRDFYVNRIIEMEEKKDGEH